jgi:hypothetical protein
MKFTATIEQNGKTATGVEVPAEVVAALGPSKRPAVRVTLAGYTYRSSVGSMGGRFMLPISAEVRKMTGVAAQDEVDVELVIDDEPREVEVPADLAAALEADHQAKVFYDGLSYSVKRRHVSAIEEAKTAETRQKRIERSLTLFHDGRS